MEEKTIQQLAEIEKRVKRLIDRYCSLKQENQQIINENIELKKQINKLSFIKSNTEEENKNLGNIVNSENINFTAIKETIDEIISEIDNSIRLIRNIE